MAALNWCVIDLETTGLSPDHTILEVGAVWADGCRGWKVRPTTHDLKMADPKALLINRYWHRCDTPEWVDALSEAQTMYQVGQAITPETTMVYWGGFDGMMLDAAARRAHMNPRYSYRSVDLSSVVNMHQGRYLSLDTALSTYGCEPILESERHTALGDAKATAELWLKLISGGSCWRE